MTRFNLKIGFDIIDNSLTNLLLVLHEMGSSKGTNLSIFTRPN